MVMDIEKDNVMKPGKGSSAPGLFCLYPETLVSASPALQGLQRVPGIASHADLLHESSCLDDLSYLGIEALSHDITVGARLKHPDI